LQLKKNKTFKVINLIIKLKFTYLLEVFITQLGLHLLDLMVERTLIYKGFSF
jgi:hypothetical protein